MSRVTVGDFATLFRRGLEDLLAASDVQLEQRRSAELSAVLRGGLPDVVLLDAERPLTRALVERIVRDHPTVQVITCTTHDPTMRVYPPFHHGESYTCPISPAEIARQLRR